MRKLNKSITR